MRTLAGCAGARGHRDGAAYVARFDAPVAVAVTGAGLHGPIYVADAGSHTLRCITGASAGCGAEAAAAAAAAEAAAAAAVLMAGVAVAGLAHTAVAAAVAGSAAGVSTLAGRPGVGGHRDGALSQSLLHGPNGLSLLPDGRLLLSDSRTGVARACISLHLPASPCLSKPNPNPNP